MALAGIQSCGNARELPDTPQAHQPGDHRLGTRHSRLRQLARRALGRKRRLQRFDIVGILIQRGRHAMNGIILGAICAT